MLGDSTVSTYCKGQAVIALSSGDAEYYGLVSATSQMLGLQCILLDWGWKFGAHVWMEATAVLRLGAGGYKRWSPKARSHSARSLPKRFLQTLTKHVDAATLQSCTARLGMRFESGESKLTLKA